MPEETKITIKVGEPATRPAIEEKTFAETYILDLAVNARALGEQDTIYLNLCPYDQATGERLLSAQSEIRLPLWEVLGNDADGKPISPGTQLIFATMPAAVKELVEYKAAKLAAAEAQRNPNKVDIKDSGLPELIK